MYVFDFTIIIDDCLLILPSLFYHYYLFTIIIDDQYHALTRKAIGHAEGALLALSLSLPTPASSPAPPLPRPAPFRSAVVAPCLLVGVDRCVRLGSEEAAITLCPTNQRPKHAFRPLNIGPRKSDFRDDSCPWSGSWFSTSLLWRSSALSLLRSLCLLRLPRLALVPRLFSFPHALRAPLSSPPQYYCLFPFFIMSTSLHIISSTLPHPCSIPSPHCVRLGHAPCAFSRAYTRYPFGPWAPPLTTLTPSPRVNVCVPCVLDSVARARSDISSRILIHLISSRTSDLTLYI